MEGQRSDERVDQPPLVKKDDRSCYKRGYVVDMPLPFGEEI